MQKTIILIALSIICFVYPREINSETLKSNDEIKQIVTDAIKEIESSANKQEKLYAVNKIYKIAYEDIEGNEVKRAVPVLIQCLKDENHKIKLQASMALGVIADERAIPALEEMKKLKTIGNPERGNYVSFHYYASHAIKQTKDRNKFLLMIKDLDEENKITYLVNSFEANTKLSYVSGKYGDVGFHWAYIYLLKIGKPVIPKIIIKFNKAIEIQKNKIKGTNSPYRTNLIFEYFSKILAEIGDESALKVLENLESYYLEDKRDDFAPKYLRDALEKIRKKQNISN
ncbi:MAG: HEAT repeat domain-containing protein [Candidatus Aureabacteria bacterium]|nr:HEAT repeat domain-containing protein [Candidatus Auribacterota bacterium]